MKNKLFSKTIFVTLMLTLFAGGTVLPALAVPHTTNISNEESALEEYLFRIELENNFKLDLNEVNNSYGDLGKRNTMYSSTQATKTPVKGGKCSASDARKKYIYGLYVISRKWDIVGVWNYVKPAGELYNELLAQFKATYSKVTVKEAKNIRERKRWQTTVYLKCENSKWVQHSFKYEYVDYKYDVVTYIYNRERFVHKNFVSKPVLTGGFKKLY